MSTTLFEWECRLGGVLTNAENMTLSVIRTDTGAIVRSPGTIPDDAIAPTTTGVYNGSVTDPALDLVYKVTWEFNHPGEPRDNVVYYKAGLQSTSSLPVAPTGNDVFMPRLLKMGATYWARDTPDGYGGGTYVTPIGLLVRWEDKLVLFTDASGRESQSSAQVYVGQDVALGGYLYLGTSTASTPALGAREIRGFEKIPNIPANKFVRRALL